MKRIISIFFLLFFVSLYARNLQYKQYNVQHGLRQSQVSKIMQLPSFEMVFGTVSGLSYYDGVEFVNPEDSVHQVHPYSLAIVDSQLWIGTQDKGIYKVRNKKLVGILNSKCGLPGNWVNEIYQKNKKIYVATNRGIVIFEDSDTTYYNRKNGLLHDVVLDIFVDNDENIWYTTFWGFGVITKEGEIINTDGRKSFKNPFCEDILVDSYGHVWVGTRKGLLIFDRDEYLLRKKLRSPLWLYAPQLKEDYITVFQEDDFHDIWIGTKHGIIKYEYSSFSEESRGQIYLNRFFYFPLKYLSIKDIYLDVENNIWIGTRGGGVFKIQGDLFWSFDLNDGLLNQEILAIYEDNKGHIWVGTNAGCSRFDGYHFTNYTTDDGLPYNIVTCFTMDKNNRIWAGTWRGIALFNGKKFIHFPIDFIKSYEQFRVYDIVQISDTILWLATWRGLAQFNITKNQYRFIDKYPELKNVRISEMKKISGNIIAFTTDNKVYLLNLKTSKLIEKNINIPKNDLKIQTVKFISPHSYLIGSNHGAYFYKADTLFYHFTKKNYLIDDGVIALLISDSVSYWFGTNKGVTHIISDKNKFIAKHYSSKNGFYGEEIITNHSIFEDRESNVWFGTFLGLSKYIKYKDIPNKIPPKIKIKSLRIFKKEVSGSSQLTLSYKENTIAISYIGISFRDESDVQYKYRLLGHQEDWSPPTAEREAVYFNLPSGTYTFQVMARNRDGIWSESPVEITFTILAPFWETPQFIALLMLITVGLVFLYFKNKIKKVRIERDILEQKVVTRTKTLIEQQKRLLETNQKLQKLTNELRTSMDKLKKAQLQLIQSEKMASLGTLIAGVTHELNNPITFIYSNFESLKEYIDSIMKLINEIKKEYYSKNEKLRKIFDEEDLDFVLEDLPQLLQGIEYGSNRIKDIVAQLYRFSHPGKNKERMDIHENIELTLNLFLNQYRQYVTIEKEFGKLPTIEAPSGELNQVFLNLLVNAAYAIKNNRGEGTIWIKTWTDEKYIYISIRDNGGGVSQEVQEKIFDPFFTTKPIGEGTGLGLSLSYNIITNLRGELILKNVDGGAEFIVKLPIENEFNVEDKNEKKV